MLDEQGLVDPRKLAAALCVTVNELAAVVGLALDTVSAETQWPARNVQRRLQEVVRILDQVGEWCGSPFQAYAWYRSEPIPSLGDVRAEALVKAGKADLVNHYLDRIAEGGYT